MKKLLSVLILSLSLFMFGCAKKETIDVIDTSGDTISITTKEGSWITFDSTGGSYAPADAGEPVGENGGRIIKEDDPKVKYYSSLALSLLWLGSMLWRRFDPWPGNFLMPWVWP